MLIAVVGLVWIAAGAIVVRYVSFWARKVDNETPPDAVSIHSGIATSGTLSIRE